MSIKYAGSAMVQHAKIDLLENQCEHTGVLVALFVLAIHLY
jgi:hypothetical protein